MDMGRALKADTRIQDSFLIHSQGCGWKVQVVFLSGVNAMICTIWDKVTSITNNKQ